MMLEPFWMGIVINLMIRSMEVVYCLEMRGGGQIAFTMPRAENVPPVVMKLKQFWMGRKRISSSMICSMTTVSYFKTLGGG